MPIDTNYFQLEFSYLYGTTKTKSDGTNETYYTSASFSVIPANTSTEITLNEGKKITPKTQLVYTTFNRKIYQPNEIIADICFSSEEITGSLYIFFNSKVSLIRVADSQEVETFTGFYVHNVLPMKKPGSNLYIRFHIFSLDHQLTIKKFSRTYVAKRLGADILKGISEDGGDVLDINKLSASPKSSAAQLKFPITVEASSFDHLKYGSSKEPFQPYLVQYNESFYDFMVRTANRCGEFFFWDNEKLCLGRSCKGEDEFNSSDCTVYYTKTNTNMDADSYKTEYNTLDDINRSQDLKATSDIGKKEDIEKNVDGKNFQYISFGNDDSNLNPAGTKEEYQYNNEVNQDVYRTRLYKNRFNSFYNISVKNAAKYITSFISTLLNETNLFDFVKKAVVTKGFSLAVAKAQLNNANKRGEKIMEAKREVVKLNSNSSSDVEKGNTAERQIKDNDNKVICANLFTTVDTDGHLTNEFYKKIRQKEEILSRQLITFSTSDNPQKLRLGQTFKYNDITYVIIQIKMKLGTNVSYFSDIDAASEEEFERMGTITEEGDGSQTVNSVMEVTAIPTDKDDNVYVYPPLHPAGHVRRSEPQVAFVAEYLDPQNRGRVRIKYPWQSAYDNEASPWIRVLTPSATPGSGCTFELEKNDEVLINYESNNIERPYVAGTLFNKNNHAPFERGDMALISKNGHGISFDDPIDFSKFIAGIFPTYNFVNQFLAIDTSEMSKSLKMTGGTTISDAYGFYKIAMSTDQRRIDISSPFGTVNIDAFQGINICAPNGDINIKGQNINIEAGNAIKVTSGTNISKKSTYFGNNADDFLSDLAKSVAGGLADYLKTITQIVDLDLLRKILQVFLRPIDGTMEIKSNQYLLLEAGPGEAMVQKDRYLEGKPPSDHNKYKLFAEEQAERNETNLYLKDSIFKIRVFSKALLDDIPTQQKKIAKLKAAYDAARTAAVNAELVENTGDNQCIDSLGILTAVYNDGTHAAQKDYAGVDKGELHLKQIQQVVAGAAPQQPPQAPQPPEDNSHPEGSGSVLEEMNIFLKNLWKKIVDWMAENLSPLRNRVKNLEEEQARLNDQQSTQANDLQAQRTNLSRLESEMNKQLQQLSNLVVTANALAQAAYDYFNKIFGLKSKLSTIVTHNNQGLSGLTHYDDELEISIGDIPDNNINKIFTYLNATNQLKECALTDQHLAEARKYIMHQWFSKCLKKINGMDDDVDEEEFSHRYKIKVKTSYSFETNPSISDNWEEYVKGLEFGNKMSVSLEKAILSQFNSITQQYADFYGDFADRSHWEPGKPGQIIFSDQPQQSYYFDKNGVSQVYENEWTTEAPSLKKLQIMLNDLN